MEKNNHFKILQSIGGLNMGGAETMVMNIFRTIDRTKFTFDFVITGQEKGYFESEAIDLGANVFHITKRSESLKKNLIEFYKICKNEKYDIIHIHTQNAFLAFLQIIISRLAGIHKIIVHSHNTNDWREGLLSKLHFLFRPFLGKISDVRLSCGKLAAEWLFGTDQNVYILPLPIKCDDFLYDSNKKIKLKKNSNLYNKVIYIHVGRFNKQKNHEFLINIFNEIKKIQPESVLLLVGEGKLKKYIYQKVINLNLVDSVIFLGNISDVNEKMIMSDIFLLPSLYEGFPTVVLEAQSAGLKSYISDTITRDIAITDLVKRIDLNLSPEKWAEIIIKNQHVNDRVKYNAVIKEKYDVSVTVNMIEKIYEGLI